jgi:hypothetical protein
MTKAALILKLYDGGLNPQEIAAEIGCSDSYVRVVARQRKGKGRSDNDWRYYKSPLGKATRREQSARYRARKHSLDCARDTSASGRSFSGGADA